MSQILNPVLEFLDRLLNVPESKATYLTHVTPIDRFLSATFLRIIPSHVTPNQITKFRLFSIPFIAFLFTFEYYEVGTTLFLFSAFSDALDGALARTKKKVTLWGTFYDPIADKLLIGTVAVIVVSKYISLSLAATIILLEIFLVALSFHRYGGRKIVPAKTIGKTKMVLQCIGVIILLFYIVFGTPVLLTMATYTLYLAVFFALLSLLVFRSI